MTMTSAEVHDALVQAWTQAPGYCTLRLVSRLASPVLGNPDSTRLYVFVPDLHLISDAKLHDYSYSTNNWEILYRSLFRLATARAPLAAQGVTTDVVQMGDLFDLWRDGHGTNRDSVAEITASWETTLKLLYRAPGDPSCLRARLLVGNHDAQMAGTPGWNLRLFFPDETAQAFALALHGDWFDPTERLPDWLSRAGLVLAGTLPQAHTYPLGELTPLLDARARAENGFQNWIQNPTPPAVGDVSLAAPTASLPAEFNVQRRGSGGEIHPFLDDARRLVETYRGRPDASPGFTRARLVIIGHTHHPRIAVDDTVDPAFVLLDTGAWIEKYKDSTGRVGPNAQFAVVCGNDARIYQFDPL
jgi:UDP-2,3-diacylglucosamine pyrophosphatase LpxH